MQLAKGALLLLAQLPPLLRSHVHELDEPQAIQQIQGTEDGNTCITGAGGAAASSMMRQPACYHAMCSHRRRSPAHAHHGCCARRVTKSTR